MYYLQDGTITSAEEIKAAFAVGRAVLVHGRAEDGMSTALTLDGQHFDTRDHCYSMWDEAWTTRPKTVQTALQAAYA